MLSHLKTQRKQKGQQRSKNSTHDALTKSRLTTQACNATGRVHPEKCGQRKERRPRKATKWNVFKKGPYNDHEKLVYEYCKGIPEMTEKRSQVEGRDGKALFGHRTGV